MRFSGKDGLSSDVQIPLAVPNLSGNEELYLRECVRTNFVSSVGPYVGEFEKQLTLRLKSKFAVATNNGTSALHLMLISAGVKPGDLVIIPSYSFIATANAVRMAGAKPWFMDIELSSWGIDPGVLRDELKSNCKKQDIGIVHKITGEKIAAIMPVYAAGHPPRIRQLGEIAQEFKIPIIYDSAAAIGSKYEGFEIGEVDSLHALSFNGNKTVTCGGGGAVILNDEGASRLIKHLSTTARTADGYSHDTEAFNYRLTNVQAAIGVAQMEQLDVFIERKRSIAKRYREELSDLSGGNFPNVASDFASDWVSGIVLKNSQREEITKIVSSLGEQGIQAREFWQPIHGMVPYRSFLASTMNSMDSLMGRVLTLPNSTSLTVEQQDKVIGSLRKILARL